MARTPRTSARANTATQPQRRSKTVQIDSVRLEGGILSSGMLAAVVARDAGEQTDADYGIRKGLVLKDEVARFFRIGRALHDQFSTTNAPSPEATVAHVSTLLREVFEFADLAPAPSRQANDRRFAIALEAGAGRVPVAIATPTEGIETPSTRLALDGRRTSAASTIQDWLDATDGATWGIATDGLVVRVLRDNASLTRPAYVDVDLARVFEAEALGDFTAAWLLLHASRFGAAGTAPEDCPLERWRAASTKQGEVARDRLRAGVEDALALLGTGFLEHPANASLRAAAVARPMAVQALFGECLQVVYRLIFLFAAEDRELLHSPTADPAARALYADGYSMSSLRTRAARRGSYDAHHDMWEGVTIVFDMLTGEDEDATTRAAKLGLPVLGGLFSEGALALLDGARLSNRRLMAAVRRLAWLDGEAGVVPVNWRDMETEELGSVYESLLELTPVLSDDGRSMTFAVGDETKGNQRKTTGSYYTPDSLVQTLLDSALNPVLDRAEREAADPVEGLLELTVIDPACGSGHFLLAAARRIATRVSRLRGGGVADRLEFRHAMRDVVRRCIHGVDRNLMAIELAKVALWIETVDPGKPLGFLDANMRCGDSLLGVFNRASLIKGIPDAAYKPLTGDDRTAARDLDRRNASEKVAQGELGLDGGANALPPAWPMVEAAAQLRMMPEETIRDVEARRRAFGREFSTGRALISMACDVHVAAFLSPKHPPENGRWPNRAPTTGDVVLVYQGHAVDHDLLTGWTGLADEARTLHWFLAFPDVMDRGGFDAVVGNPPWERIKLQEQEFFAALDPEIAGAPNAAARTRLIAVLGEAAIGTPGRALHEAFERAKRTAEAASTFVRVAGEEGGRFPLTGRGDVNTYALFAELFARLTNPRGRAGIIVPTGIATDAMTAPFFVDLISQAKLVSLFSFFEVRRFFPATDDNKSFCILTIGQSKAAAEFTFQLENVTDIKSVERRFTLSAGEIARINPNSRTAPVFRSRADAELTASIYARTPVLIEEGRGREKNPWGLSYMAMLHMSGDSGLFRTATQLVAGGFVRHGTCWESAGSAMAAKQVLPLASETNWAALPLDSALDHAPERYLPLTEAKMFHHFDHRWATYDNAGDRDSTAAEHADPAFEPTPRYWVPEREVETRLANKGWMRGWLMGWRDISKSWNERTVIFGLLPRVAIGHTAPLMFSPAEPRLLAALIGNMNALVLDFIARQKVGGTHLTYGYLNQFAVLPPHAYTAADIAFIVPRILELTYTSHSMAPFARDLGHEGPPFAWNEDRRALLRAELDVRYARLYGLSYDELRYVLDPGEVRGPDYPSETFRVLKNNEARRFNEYRTARLVKAAWDAEVACLRSAAE